MGRPAPRNCKQRNNSALSNMNGTGRMQKDKPCYGRAKAQDNRSWAPSAEQCGQEDSREQGYELHLLELTGKEQPRAHSGGKERGSDRPSTLGRAPSGQLR
jgi:hypothetical protein